LGWIHGADDLVSGIQNAEGCEVAGLEHAEIPE